MLTPVGLQAAEPVPVRLIDADGKPTAARVSITDSAGEALAPEGAIVRKSKAGTSYFYADGEFKVAIPNGPAKMLISGGIETIPQAVTITAAKPKPVTVRMKRWIDTASRGWYSGDSHVHLHTGGPLAVTVKDALTAARAEGVNYVNLCVSNNVGDDIRDADLITGQPHEASTAKHLLVFGEEMRSMIYGHMQFFGIRKLVEPQYTGFDNTPNNLDFPANYTMAAEAVRQGGLVTYGHPMFKDKPDSFDQDLTKPNAAARELPVDAILGVAHAIDLMSYNSDEERSAELWYRLLNCGLKLSACVGTDALLDRSTDPLGGDRVYVKIDGRLTMASWLDGLKNGRTFVTNGPMIDLRVNDREVGETVVLDQAGRLDVEVTVETHVPVTKIDLIVNGQVVTSLETQPRPIESSKTLRHRIRIPVDRSSWIAVRVHGPDHPSLFDGPAWAHTSPVFVTVGGKPVSSREDAAYFVDF